MSWQHYPVQGLEYICCLQANNHRATHRRWPMSRVSSKPIYPNEGIIVQCSAIAEKVTVALDYKLQHVCRWRGIWVWRVSVEDTVWLKWTATISYWYFYQIRIDRAFKLILVTVQFIVEKYAETFSFTAFRKIFDERN